MIITSISPLSNMNKKYEIQNTVIMEVGSEITPSRTLRLWRVTFYIKGIQWLNRLRCLKVHVTRDLRKNLCKRIKTYGWRKVVGQSSPQWECVSSHEKCRKEADVLRLDTNMFILLKCNIIQMLQLSLSSRIKYVMFLEEWK